MGFLGSTTDKPTLVIGDIHGHLDRLEALLTQEGILSSCGMCGGSGDVGLIDPEFCPACEGIGILRTNHDVCVVQLGDVAHNGHSGSPTADFLAWKYCDQWCDVVLWGNHDRAVMSEVHHFAGYQKPMIEVEHLMKLKQHDGTLKLALEAHGYLLTHAGLHAQFKYNQVPEGCHDDPVLLAEWLNEMDLKDDPTFAPHGNAFVSIRDAVGHSRGGRSPFGGLLWRDASESWYDGFPQIFGHSSKPKVRQYQSKRGTSYCVDIGDATNGKLAGIWLPEMQVVEINTNQQ